MFPLHLDKQGELELITGFRCFHCFEDK